MLNLYLTSKSRKSPNPEAEAIDEAITFLKEEGIIGPSIGENEYGAGNHSSIFFHSDSDQHFLPVELTFDSWGVYCEPREIFLPRDQDVCAFDQTACSVCDEPVEERELEKTIERLDFLPVDRVVYECPCCQSDVPFSQLDFGQPTAVARFWFFIEGAVSSRLNPSIVDELGKILGFPLVLIPEVIQHRNESWKELAHPKRRS